MKNILWLSFLATWTMPLLRAIRRQHQGKLGVIVPVFDEMDSYKQVEDIDFYYLRFTNKQLYSPMNRAVFAKINNIIQQFKPDIVHVHGTEKNLAQIQNYLSDIPVVISIQGIMMSYKPFALNFLDAHELSKHKSLKNRLGIGGTRKLYQLFTESYKYEQDIFEKGKYFIGRTKWDKANVLFRNQFARYYQGEELLREEFYKAAGSWTLNNCIKCRILMPAGFNPIKGLHIAIEAVNLVVKYYPETQLIVPDIVHSTLKNSAMLEGVIGDEYILYIKSLIKRYGLEKNIVLESRLDASSMVREMQRAHVFLSPSSIDNSPNTLGEASIIGLPIVTTAVGGILSIFENNVNCLYAPAGDAYLIAAKLKELFDSEALAEKLSRNAYQLAISRHNPKRTSLAYIEIYNQILSEQ